MVLVSGPSVTSSFSPTTTPAAAAAAAEDDDEASVEDDELEGSLSFIVCREKKFFGFGFLVQVVSLFCICFVCFGLVSAWGWV